jgi:hypothetical protein
MTIEDIAMAFNLPEVSARRTRLDEFSGVVCASPRRQGR